jgi:hypothetical protein
MRTEIELLASLKNNRAERVRLLMQKDKEQLIKMIERMGHFNLADEDIQWLENKIKQEA